MKKLIVTMFLLSLTLSLPFVFAQENELEAAISRLWLAGPDEKIEQTLKTHSESSDPAVSARARFHLTCLQAINDRENAAQLLTQLVRDAQSAEEKETVEKLSRVLQERAAKKKDGMQKKISLDFTDIELGQVVKLIAKQSGENIVVHNSLNGIKISLRLMDATVAQSIETICTIADLRQENKNGVYVLLPGNATDENYVKRFYKLTAISPTRALKMLEAGAAIPDGSNAPAGFADAKKAPAAMPELPSGVSVSVKGNELLFEGPPEAVRQYISFIENLDLKDRAHKLSFRVWRLNDDCRHNLKTFTALDEQERAKVARIISAPALITLPGKLATIEVDNFTGEKKEQPKESIDFSIASKFIDTEKPELLRLTLDISVFGTSIINSKQIKTTRKYNTSLQITRNTWAMLPFYEGEALLYLEVQASSH
ncbi:MAG: hypothetical protein CVV42_12675 [Candidatus Riflebacteria bacterium HGW-Riflebacteria-2]|jgi:hypothetical protein|nr:MAG: hypothetical protein CVV42_12675 [Candidatus Riflebacteria bacterium HGW-Riflebacteria-2]